MQPPHIGEADFICVVVHVYLARILPSSGMLKNFASSSIIFYTGVIWELTAVSFGDTEDEVPNRYRDERKGE